MISKQNIKYTVMKSKNILLLLLFSLCMLPQTFAQKRSFDIEAFKKKKSEYIIQKVGLSDIEIKAFIPLTNELMDKRFEINRQMRRNAREIRKKEHKTEADYEQLINEAAEVKLKEAQLDKEYLQKFKQVLPAEKIYKYLQAEAEFMKEVLDKRYHNHK